MLIKYAHANYAHHFQRTLSFLTIVNVEYYELC